MSAYSETEGQPKMAAHSISNLITLSEFAGHPDCPFKIDRLRQVANLSLKGDKKYKRLPFFQPTKGGKILVNPELFRRRIYEMGASAGYREMAV